MGLALAVPLVAVAPGPSLRHEEVLSVSFSISRLSLSSYWPLYLSSVLPLLLTKRCWKDCSKILEGKDGRILQINDPWHVRRICVSQIDDFHSTILRYFCAVRARLTILLSLLMLVLSGCLASCSIFPSGQATTGPLSLQQDPHARLTYVAIGASDTYGVGTDDPPSQSWPADLVTMLGSGVRLINLGVPDMHAHDALNVELPVALDTHPNLVTVWLAVNDLADNVPLDSYSHDLDQLLTRLQATAPHAQILVANVPDITLLPHFRSYDAQALHAQITAYNTVIATVVQRHHVLLVDLYQQWRELASHPEYISNDGFHPNAIGYSRLAEIFDQVLQKNGL